MTPEQAKRLREWWVPEDYDLVIATAGFIYPFPIKIGPDKKIYDARDGERHYGLIWCDPEKLQPILSIGQMIELLMVLTEDIPNKRVMIWQMCSMQWNVEMLDAKDGEWGSNHIWVKDTPELADALWQAVKEGL